MTEVKSGGRVDRRRSLAAMGLDVAGRVADTPTAVHVVILPDMADCFA